MCCRLGVRGGHGGRQPPGSVARQGTARPHPAAPALGPAPAQGHRQLDTGAGHGHPQPPGDRRGDRDGVVRGECATKQQVKVASLPWEPDLLWGKGHRDMLCGSCIYF